MKLVDLPTARTLQELGYNGEYTMCYIRGSEEPTEAFTPIARRKFIAPAPRLDDAAYWLREKHHLSIRLNYGREFGWFADILNISTGQYIDCNFCPTYDDALEHAVTKAIEIIKNKKQ